MYVPWVCDSPFLQMLLLSQTRKRNVGDDRCILYHKHVFVVPGEPPCHNCSYVSYGSLPWLSRLLPSWAPRGPAVSGLYFTIERLSVYPKPFPLNDPISLCMEALWQNYVEWCSFYRSVRLRSLSICEWLETRIPIPLVSWYVMTKSWDYGAAMTFNLSISLRVIGWCSELIYPEKNARGWKELAHNLELLKSQYVGRHSISHYQIFQEYCRYLSRINFACGDRLCQFSEPVWYYNETLIGIRGP